jgi:hypothetical protein
VWAGGPTRSWRGPISLSERAAKRAHRFNRRNFLKGGTVAWNPGKLNSNIVRPAGPIDPELPVVLFESEKGDSIATYVNFAMHQDTVGGLEVSADYAHTLSTMLRKESASPKYWPTQSGIQ